MTKIKKYSLTALGMLFWLAVWEISAIVLDVGFILPTVEATLAELIKLFISADFYLAILFSVLRIIIGLTIGILLGGVLAFLCYYAPYVRSFITPPMSIIKATPVASFILVLWLIVGSTYTPTVIALLMVMPIVWQNLDSGFASIDNERLEVCAIYEIKGYKKFKILILPTLKNYLIPSIITSAALAWKSGIAAEIIAYTKNSIGGNIYDAKVLFESGKMFAWTAIVIVLSFVLEKALSLMKKREVGREK